MAGKLPDLIMDIKNIITPILTNKSRNEEKVTVMLELHISGLNLDNYILKMLHQALPTAKSDFSVSSLSKAPSTSTTTPPTLNTPRTAFSRQQ